MMEYLNKFWAIFGLLGLLGWWISFFNFGKKAQIVFYGNQTRRVVTFKRLLVFLLGSMAWLFISYAMMGPRSPIGREKNKIEVNDIFFVVDVSRSMLATDFAPNRLEAAKEKIKEFVELRPSDRIGIVMFAERAFTLLPLSTDLELIKRIISEIKIGFLGSGTNIGDALALAVGRGSQSLAKNKVVILLTDGVSNVGFLTPLQAAEQAKEQGMKVYTIGIGGRSDAKIPAIGGRGFQRIPGGSIDVATLEKISNITGGKTYVAQNIRALKNVLAEIEKLERTEIDMSAKIIYKEHYYKFLMIGAFLLLLVEILRKKLMREGL